MARPPQLQLKREDYASVQDDWMDRLIRALNTFGKQVAGAFTGGITFGENVVAFQKEMPLEVVPSGEARARMKNDLPGGAKPTGVLVLAAVETPDGGAEVPVSLGTPAWFTQGDEIRILSIGGADAAKKYRVTLLVLGG